MRARWDPREGRGIYNLDALKAGDLIAVDHPDFRNKPWRIYEIKQRDERSYEVILRPDGELFDFAQYNHVIGIRRNAPIYLLPEHYGLCHTCGELMPCSEVWAERISTESAKQAGRFEVEGICPSCQEPVTARQKSHRFEENLRVPLGPPVTFHARSRCRGGARDYDGAVARATGRDPWLFCEGMLTGHLDNHEECTNVTCPSLAVAHRSFAMCYVLSAKCNRPECWAMNERERNGA